MKDEEKIAKRYRIDDSVLRNALPELYARYEAADRAMVEAVGTRNIYYGDLRSVCLFYYTKDRPRQWWPSGVAKPLEELAKSIKQLTDALHDMGVDATPLMDSAEPIGSDDDPIGWFIEGKELFSVQLNKSGKMLAKRLGCGENGFVPAEPVSYRRALDYDNDDD